MSISHTTLFREDLNRKNKTKMVSLEYKDKSGQIRPLQLFDDRIVEVSGDGTLNNPKNPAKTCMNALLFLRQKEVKLKSELNGVTKKLKEKKKESGETSRRRERLMKEHRDWNVELALNFHLLMAEKDRFYRENGGTGGGEPLEEGIEPAVDDLGAGGYFFGGSDAGPNGSGVTTKPQASTSATTSSMRYVRTVPNPPLLSTRLAHALASADPLSTAP